PGGRLHGPPAGGMPVGWPPLLTAPVLTATVIPRRTRPPPPATMRSTARWIAAWAGASDGGYPGASVTWTVRSLSPPPGSRANPATGGSPASAAAARACMSGSLCGSGGGRPSASAASRAPSTANGTGLPDPGAGHRHRPGVGPPPGQRRQAGEGQHGPPAVAAEQGGQRHLAG